jgi:hypothetical protein
MMEPEILEIQAKPEIPQPRDEVLQAFMNIQKVVANSNGNAIYHTTLNQNLLLIAQRLGLAV